MKHLVQLWVRGAVVVGVTALSACGMAQRLDDATRIQYEAAPAARKLEWPPDLVAAPHGAVAGSGTTLSAFEQQRESSRPTVPVAPAARVLPKVAGVRIERQGQQRWLVVDQPPELVWPIVREFWVQSGFELSTESPETGVLETDWRQQRPDVDGSRMRAALARWLGSLYASAERDKFRSRLEAVGAGTEIFVSHRGMSETWTGPLKDTVLWVARPADPELEAEWLQRLALRLGAASQPQAVASEARKAAAAAPAAEVPVAQVPERAQLRTVTGQTDLWLQDEPERAWRQLGLALDRLGFTVQDRDRARGTFYVRYVDPEPAAGAKGLAQKVFGTGPKKDLRGKPYQIALTRSEDQSGTMVTVLDEAGKLPESADDQRVAAQIVRLLHGQLR